MNGRIVPWAESMVHVNTDAVLRGASCFEGLRAYRSSAGDDLLLFRMADHMKRLFGTSMRVLRMNLPYSAEQLTAGVIDLLKANGVRDDAHIRVVAYFGELEFGRDLETPAGAYMLAFPRQPSPKISTGVRSMVSMWRRLSDTSMSPRVKSSANYLNSRLAMVDARVKGFDIPVLLNERGKVSEGPGQNVFLVRDGVLITPRTTDAILEGITRSTIITLAGELGTRVEEREVDTTELYVAEELFFAGTAMEVQPVIEIDGYTVSGGRMGALTERLQTAYWELVRGGAANRPGWLTPVYGAAVPAAASTTP
jgi:branched-chain amino acid aminotransferase